MILTYDKITEIFCILDDFCKIFDKIIERHAVKSSGKRGYHRDGRMSKAEVMMVIIMFHCSGYRCLKHFYIDHICGQRLLPLPEETVYQRQPCLRQPAHTVLISSVTYCNTTYYTNFIDKTQDHQWSHTSVSGYITQPAMGQ